MLEVKDIASQLGFKEEDFEDKTSLKTALDGDSGYIPRAKVFEDDAVVKHFNDSTGERFGKLEAQLRSSFKELGVDELESGKVEEMLISGTKQAKNTYQKAIDDAKKDEGTKLTEITTERDKYKSSSESEKERADKANDLLKKTEDEFGTYKTDLKKSTLYDKEYKTVEFIPDITDLQRRGYDAVVAETYEFRLAKDEKSLEPWKDGKRAKTEAGNENLTVSEALSLVANENNLLRKNRGAQPIVQLQVQPGVQPGIQQVQQIPGKPEPRTAQTLKNNPKLAQ